MKFTYIKTLSLAAVIFLGGVACTDDLDITPTDEVTSATVYNSFENYQRVLAKVYAGYSVTGQEGPAGSADVQGVDEGTSSYVRTYWKLQELPTDEAVIGWGDPGVPELNTMQWTADNVISRAMYYRIFYQITLANEFIRESTEAKVEERGYTGSEAELLAQYHAEARFLRALSYWHAIDLFGRVPFVDETSPIGAFFPEQITRSDLFDYVEKELLAVEAELPLASATDYGRANKAAVWMTLAKLYLNAEVYTGTAHYADALTYAKKVIDSGFMIEPNYEHLFLADNNTASGIIFPITFDGINTRTWGGTTFLVHAPVGGSMNAAAFGIDGGWGGIRTTKAFVNLFTGTADELGNWIDPDSRSLFYVGDGIDSTASTLDQKLEIEDLGTFTDGYGITKWKNITSDGQPGQRLDQVDTDFPMFRLADAYLMYAEAVLRGGGGDVNTAVMLINELRERAYGDTSGNITAGELDLDFILAERGRELYWEAHRRTDLIRFGKFTGGEYLWPLKGGALQGTSVPDYLKVYPLPTDDVLANPNLDPTDGY